jgi:hypothetical protein
MKIIVTLLTSLLTACAGPAALSYSAVSLGWAATGGKSPSEHVASWLTDADCDIGHAVRNLAYVCERNRDPARVYNRDPF